MTKRTVFFLLAAAAAGTFWLQAADYKDAQTARDEKEVLNVKSQWSKAVQAGDTATLERLLAPEYTVVDAMGKTHTKPQEIAMLGSGDLKIDSLSTSGQAIKIYVGGAIVTGTAAIKGKHKGEDISGEYRFVEIIEPRKAGWQPVFSQFTKIEKEDKKTTVAK